MVDEQKTDAKLVCQLFEDTKLGVVPTVGDLGSWRADELEGVDGNQSDCRVLPFELTDKVADSALN